MVRSARSVPNHAGLLVLLATVVLGAGCDVLGFGTAGPARPSFTVVSDSTFEVRVRVLGGHSGASFKAHTAPDSLTPVVKVKPPTVRGTRTQAGHLSYDAETARLYVGYKLAGSIFGGGIDILNVQPGASPGNLVDGRRSLRSSNVDVVTLQAGAEEGTLYVAGAVTTKKRRLSPAVVSKITASDSGLAAQSKRLSHNVAKSVILGPAPNTIHVATDENALFQFDPTLTDKSKLTVGSTSGFRSAAAHDSAVFVLDRSGRVFGTDASAFQDLSRVVRLTGSDFGTGGAVARLHAHGDRLYAALNEKGFALFSPTGEPVWTSDPVFIQARYTCVTVGSTYLYAGRFDGVIEVYRRPASISEAPELVGTFGPWGDDYGSRLSGAPINHILVIENHLYVAKSRDGMVVFRIDRG
ncbi:MAG: hypothetical protein ABEL51_10315 [Salinibacter sp.]